jgi:hypothetical protein
MEYRTMSRKELCVELDISYSKLWRDMKELDPEFQKRVAGRILYDEDVKYIDENLKGLEKAESGSE